MMMDGTMINMKILLIMILAVLSGCASLNYAGSAVYSVKPFIDKKGETQCCEVLVRNGKEIGSLEATMEVKKDGSYKVHLIEQSVKAFEGQRISADVAKAGIKATATTAAIISPASTVGSGLGTLVK